MLLTILTYGMASVFLVILGILIGEANNTSGGTWVTVVVAFIAAISSMFGNWLTHRRTMALQQKAEGIETKADVAAKKADEVKEALNHQTEDAVRNTEIINTKVDEIREKTKVIETQTNGVTKERHDELVKMLSAQNNAMDRQKELLVEQAREIEKLKKQLPNKS